MVVTVKISKRDRCETYFGGCDIDCQFDWIENFLGDELNTFLNVSVGVSRDGWHVSQQTNEERPALIVSGTIQ